MRRSVFAGYWRFGAIGLALAATGMFASGQEAEESPFLGHGDRGELVHVLPPPAAIRTADDNTPVVGGPHSGVSVYRASYGSGNLQYHGGAVMTTPAFYPIFWNSTVAGATGSSQGYGTIQNQISSFASAYLNGATKYTQASTDD